MIVWRRAGCFQKSLSLLVRPEQVVQRMGSGTWQGFVAIALNQQPPYIVFAMLLRARLHKDACGMTKNLALHHKSVAYLGLQQLLSARGVELVVHVVLVGAWVRLQERDKQLYVLQQYLQTRNGGAAKCKQMRSAACWHSSNVILAMYDEI